MRLPHRGLEGVPLDGVAVGVEPAPAVAAVGPPPPVAALQLGGVADTDAEGFAYAIDVGHELVRHDVLTKIVQTLAEHRRDAHLPESARLAGGAAS